MAFTVTIDRPGARSIEATPQADSLTWSTAAVGGFASCELAIPGVLPQDVPYLSRITLRWGTFVLWQGRVEDRRLKLTKGGVALTVRGYGLRRLFDDNSVRRLWANRNVPWAEVPGLSGTVGATSISFDPQTWNAITVGQFDPTDLTRIGVQILATSGIACSAGAAGGVRWYTGGVQILQLLLDVVCSQILGDTVNYAVRDSVDGNVYNTLASGRVTNLTSLTLPFTRGATIAQLLAYYPAGNANAHADVRYQNIRVLGAISSEDSPGGFYGGTLLRDLVGLIPDLTIGVVEQGSDFLIQSLERQVRTACADVLAEITGYYTREWAVWEDGRFDWRQPVLDEPQWIITLAELADLDITASLDTLSRTSYVLYTDAAGGYTTEQNYPGQDQRNPYVRTGSAKDFLTSPSFQMTTATASQLAQKIQGDRGTYPAVSGTVTIAAQQLVRRQHGSPGPAFLIRAGENILIPDMPKDDVFATGRDGQTLFHITDVVADLKASKVTFSVEGQTRRSDTLLARLAAATRVLTG